MQTKSEEPINSTGSEEPAQVMTGNSDASPTPDLPLIDSDKKPFKAYQPSRMMQLHKGFEWNPLRQLPRNMLCPCQSGKKFKACHLQKLPLAVPTAVAESFREQMRKPALIFKTEENKDMFPDAEPSSSDLSALQKAD